MRLLMVFLCVIFLVQSSGCVALLAGAAGGAGTAVWLSGKISQEVDASLERSDRACQSAFRALKLDITKEIKKDDVVQITGAYTDGRTVWVDVHKLTAVRSRIEVRVGAGGDQEAARKILDTLLRYL